MIAYPLRTQLRSERDWAPTPTPIDGKPTLVIQTSSWARKLDIDRTARMSAGRLVAAADGRVPARVGDSCRVMATRNRWASSRFWTVLPRNLKSSGLICQETP